MMHNIAAAFTAAQIFLALSAGAVADAADSIRSVVNARTSAEDSRPLQLPISTEIEDGPTCACSPSKITFQLDYLNASCDSYWDSVADSSNGKVGKPGVDDTLCHIYSPNWEVEVTDLTPVEITSGVVIEIGAFNVNTTNWKMVDIDMPLKNGDTIEYESMSYGLDREESLEDQGEKIPANLAIELKGKNADGQEIIYLLNWMYDVANCDAEPIEEGDGVGWVTVVNVTSASPEFCDAAAVETGPRLAQQ